MKLIHSAMQMCGIPDRFIDADLKIFNSEKLIKQHMKDHNSLFLVGPKGSGKTHMMAAMTHNCIYPIVEIKERLEQNLDTIPSYVAFWSMTKLLHDLRQSFKQDTIPTEKEIVDRCIKVKWLFLDDIGAEKASDWTLQTLYLIINERYGAMKPVVISSNSDMKQLTTHIGDRITSRLAGMCKTILMTGEDMRMKP